MSRTERLIAAEGFGPLTESSVEVIGSGDVLGGPGRPDMATEVVLKVGVRHGEAAALEIFSTEFVPFGLVAQGMTGVFAGRPRVAPVYRVFQMLIDKGGVRRPSTLAETTRPWRSLRAAAMRRSPRRRSARTRHRPPREA